MALDIVLRAALLSYGLFTLLCFTVVAIVSRVSRLLTRSSSTDQILLEQGGPAITRSILSSSTRTQPTDRTKLSTIFGTCEILSRALPIISSA